MLAAVYPAASLPLFVRPNFLPYERLNHKQGKVA
jgi:hypothetical protein